MRAYLGDCLGRVQDVLRSIGKKEPTDKQKELLAVIDKALGDSDAHELYESMRTLLETMTKDGVAEALVQVGIHDDDSIVELANDNAIAYAQERAADMVGMRMVDGELVPNPDAEWRIDDVTREMLRGDVIDAMESGLSNDELADQLADAYAFSDARAETIARTETAYADVNGNLIAWRASGEVTAKEWAASGDCCDDCQKLNGTVVPLDEDFPNDGGDGPPLHPRCECDVLPHLAPLNEDD